ncbi:tRNA (adenosine(37)-N6)-threonylcarbamoyltransferase complex dimerization subunit type 1 TsaB [Olivibacter sp. CPCC 100613]|uniref:tRNA (adenosine(37)-N6)-threonylcarbamoyltransferase complex dimerization subunit type 1 TsaB n=1 Tax=Olivibacter sp. CPCC 100613 TaxID=3079931 RepID=UPI002FF97A07
MIILHIETATSVCSVALSKGGLICAYIDRHEPNIHASKLTVFINEVLNQANCKIEELDAVAISKGPGSYTGLRIGVSTAKGICFALDIPLIAVDTLEAMCIGFVSEINAGAQSGDLFCPMIDARRMEVYTAMYNAQGMQIQPVGARIIDVHSFEEFSAKQQRVVLFGDGANKFSSLFEGNETVVVVNNFLNSARHLGRESYRRWENKQFEDVAYFEPFYLKDFIPTTPKRLLKP